MASQRPSSYPSRMPTATPGPSGRRASPTNTSAPASASAYSPLENIVGIGPGIGRIAHQLGLRRTGEPHRRGQRRRRTATAGRSPIIGSIVSQLRTIAPHGIGMGGAGGM